jgi:multicomponent K+:H+ antiporter subunit E
MLANTISLTPGTLSAELSDDRSELLVHYLDEADPDGMVALIKSRYERPLLEIFG